MISFNEIPVNLLVPGVYVEIDNTRAANGLFMVPTRILVIGQRLVTGTVPALVPTRITADDQGDQSFGAGSMLAHMLRALRKANRFTETWAVALDDLGAGVQAAGAIDFGGVLTGGGTINLYIGGRRLRVGAASTDTPAAIATAVAAAITAATDLPVTAAVDGVDTAKVNVTARHKGEAGNGIDLRVNYYEGEQLPPGLTVDITAMAGGSGNPDLEAALDLMGDTWYTDLVIPYTDAASLTAVETALRENFGPLRMRDGHAWAAASGTHAQLGTLGDSRNSPHLTVWGLKGCPTPPWERAAALAGVAAYHLSIDPARPLQTLVVPGVMAPAVADRFTFEERNLLLLDGIATTRVDDGGQVVIERTVTTYKTNAFGAADPSYLDVETLKTLAFLRYDLRTFASVRYPRHKLAGDETEVQPGQAIVRPKDLRVQIIARAGLWEQQGLVESLAQFKQDILVTRDPNDVNRVNARIPPDLVNGLRVFAAQLQFLA